MANQHVTVSTTDRRTIVQPVEMPHMWASRSQAPAMAWLAESADPLHESLRRITSADALLDGGQREFVLRRSPGTELGSARTMLGRLTSRVCRPGASPTPREPLERQVTEHVEGLLQLLREIDAAGGHDRVAKCRAAINRIEGILTIVSSIGGGTALAQLVSALSGLRDGLRAAVAADECLQIADRKLTDLWAGLSEQRALRRRFWDKV